ncbi:serine-type D-Ala-D-Ala carboxypeptidase [Marvinbryantia formatexigens DSM 14469]|uniref:serine-type D-Ala-D-Ala carboxypeptidase n=1 Tax=Marvinbryantia formatexigens DSM 14469 TaxID=478749 RepID=C6LMD8_9FIRM|nr:D-alanyl-D-alanine carboxypeptidase family protein [Marvinbryantia formatexigens]EET58199.1 serine-type D-Ala-D-Ala carboxypeptidase [Marvinbryantia formatexigens DSM 14469]UWO25477.1 D-alanyl-D-alanine carboxypeptidase [Marvinbryantia formatexigens DSM 14469]SDG91238.1 D-alanyl-D-alanine carboxypeptidase (penicillin-binding protein 5/6) [Marvinbryantia formatexigens]
MKKKWRRFLACLSALLVMMSGSAAATEEVPEELKNLYAHSAVLMDGGSGRILFGKNEEEVLPMASTTKIMTCILTLESGRQGEIAVASANAAAQPKVHLGVRTGEEFYVEDLLYSLMLESHNDSAVMIAEHIGGSVEGFAAMMNEKAAQLGCVSTHFVTPNGLDATDGSGTHSTTAADLAEIMRYCVSISPQREAFLQITQTRSYSFSNVEQSRSFSCQNHNAFMDMMEGVISGKTGFTSAAGYCYVCALEDDGRLFIVALLACGWPDNRTWKWRDAAALLGYGKENYHNQTINCTEKPRTLTVEGGLSGDKNPWREAVVEAVPDTAAASGKQYLLRDGEQIRSRLTIRKGLQAPVEKGEVVGRISYYLDDNLLEEYPFVTTASVPEKSFTDWLSWLWKAYTM